MIGSKRLARTAGVLYLAIIGFGVFAELLARQAVFVAGDAAATAANIVENSAMFRLGIAADILMALAYIGIGVALTRLFVDIDRGLARLITVFATAGATMILVNLVFHAGALEVATNSELAGQLGGESPGGLAYLFLTMHGLLYNFGGVFFGLWLLPTGLLMYRSGAFPTWLSYAVIVAAVLWLVVTIVHVVAPDLGSPWIDIIDLPTSIGEFWLALYLLTVGRRADHKIRQVPAAA